MITWEDLIAMSSFPQDGKRILVGKHGQTFTSGDNGKSTYRVYAFFELDIIQYAWDHNEPNKYYICSQNHKIVDSDFILHTYNKYCVIFNELDRK